MDDTLESAAFNKQRRNLILSTVALFFIQTTGAIIKADGNLGGFIFQLPNPAYVELWLWALMAYFLWRYHLYLRKTHAYRRPYVDRRDELQQKMLRATLMKAVASRNPVLYFDATYVPVSYRSNGIAMQATTDSIRPPSQQAITIEPVTVSLTKAQQRVTSIAALLGVSITDSAFSDYILPILLPFAPILYQLFR